MLHIKASRPSYIIAGHKQEGREKKIMGRILFPCLPYNTAPWGRTSTHNAFTWPLKEIWRQCYQYWFFPIKNRKLKRAGTLHIPNNETHNLSMVHIEFGHKYYCVCYYYKQNISTQVVACLEMSPIFPRKQEKLQCFEIYISYKASGLAMQVQNCLSWSCIS